jgi:hypothetical protein
VNEDNKKQIIALTVLGVLLGGVVVKNMMGATSTPTASASTQTANAAAGGAAGNAGGSVFDEIDIDIQELVQNIKEVNFSYDDEHLARNPSAPLVGSYAIYAKKAELDNGEGPSTDNLLYEANRKKVTGIIWDSTNPMAVIDDQVVHVGYRFEEPISVKAILQDHVVLSLANDGLDIIRELKEQ